MLELVNHITDTLLLSLSGISVKLLRGHKVTVVVEASEVRLSLAASAIASSTLMPVLLHRGLRLRVMSAVAEC